jgi:hypothetical protein
MPEENAKRLIGTWKLVSAVREERPSGRRTDLFGLLVRSDRKRPAGYPVSADEAVSLFRGMMSYAGTWEVKGDEVFHHVDASANELWTGDTQQRFLRFDGDRLSLSTPVSPDPIDGKISIRSMLWERVK